MKCHACMYLVISINKTLSQETYAYHHMAYICDSWFTLVMHVIHMIPGSFNFNSVSCRLILVSHYVMCSVCSVHESDYIQLCMHSVTWFTWLTLMIHESNDDCLILSLATCPVWTPFFTWFSHDLSCWLTLTINTLIILHLFVM